MTMKPYPVVGPWKGIITDVPSGFDPQAFDQANNVVFRKSRIQSRPALVQSLGNPPDNGIIRGIYSFLDAAENWHTLVLTNLHAYFLTNVAGILTYNLLSMPSSYALSTLAGNLPYSIVEMDQQVFFCNGGTALFYVDGSSAIQQAGDVGGACKYLAENSGYLIGVNWTIPPVGILNPIDYPFLVRFASAGEPTVWTPGLGNSAGEINLIERGGIPTGAQTLGAYTYIWRQFGANVLWPTGQAQAAFYNEPFMWSNPGWGNYYPYSLATWNQQGIFATHNGEVLLFNGAAGPSSQNFIPLAGGKVKKSIAADLQSAAGDQVIAFVTDQLGPGFDFESYQLWIPGLNKGWVFNLTEGSWQTCTTLGHFPTAFGNVKVH